MLKIALHAFHKNLSLKEACVEMSALSGEEFDRLVIPESMVGNH